MPPTPIPMSSPDLTDAEVSAVHEVLSTRYLALGPRLEAFERAVADYAGAAHAIGVNSGTSALHLAILAAGVGEGDGVITTPFSFIASANCILYERGVPVFVDVDPTTGNVDPALVAQAAHDLTRGGPAAERWLPRSHVHTLTRSNVQTLQRSNALPLSALLPVHAFGQPADMGPLIEVAREHGLAVIEDACEAIGAEYVPSEGGPPRKAGTMGDVGVFAFYPNKQITTGEGGMLVTGHRDWADLFRSLRNQGRDVFDAWLNHTRLGYNYRLDEMSAALGLAQMERVDELLARRAQVARWYDERLADVEGVTPPHLAPTTARMSWFVYVVRIEERSNVPTFQPVNVQTSQRRNAVMRALAEADIPSRPYFTPIHLQPFYRDTFGYQRGDFPVTEHLGDVSLALPFSSVMTEEQVDRVCAALRTAVESASS